MRKKIKLHLGCGTVYLRSWVNCDVEGLMAENNDDIVQHNGTNIEHYYKYPYGDPYKDIGNRPCGNMVVMDMQLDISIIPYSFGDNVVDKILAVSVLEHFTEVDAGLILQEWHRILLPGGYVIISVPDLIKTAKLVKKKDTTKWAISLIYGSQKNIYSYHKWGYTQTTLMDLCLESGFTPQSIPNIIKHEYPMFTIKAVK